MRCPIIPQSFQSYTGAYCNFAQNVQHLAAQTFITSQYSGIPLEYHQEHQPPIYNAYRKTNSYSIFVFNFMYQYQLIAKHASDKYTLFSKILFLNPFPPIYFPKNVVCFIHFTSAAYIQMRFRQDLITEAHTMNPDQTAHKRAVSLIRVHSVFLLGSLRTYIVYTYVDEEQTTELVTGGKRVMAHACYMYSRTCVKRPL